MSAGAGHRDKESLVVHIRALHLLRYPERLGHGDAIRQVLMGLKRVRDKYAAGAVEPEA